MSKFNIEMLTNRKPKKISGIWNYWASITIGDYIEDFLLAVDSWALDEYLRQWKDGLEKLKTHDVSCLVADITTMATNPRVNFWCLYKEKNTIFIQYQCLSASSLKKLAFRKKLRSFSIYTCYDYILPRVKQKNGRPDEWSISEKDFFASADKLVKGLDETLNN